MLAFHHPQINGALYAALSFGEGVQLGEVQVGVVAVASVLKSGVGAVKLIAESQSLTRECALQLANELIACVAAIDAQAP